MGQSSSSSSTPSSTGPPLTKTQALFQSLSKTLPPLSLQDYNEIFSSLADSTTDKSLQFWKEDTLARYLELPGKIGSLLFKSASYLAALPTLENVPVPLNREGLGVAVMVLTQQVPSEVLTTREINRLVFNSFAEIPVREQDEKKETADVENSATGTYGPQIHVSTMIELILFLLSITTSESLTSSENTIASTEPANRHSAAIAAKSILSTIQSYAENSSSEVINYDSFRAFLEHDAPYFFDPLVPLFMNLLYDKQKWGDRPMIREDWVGALQVEKLSNVMNVSTLAQLSTFFPKGRRLGKLVALYAGSKDGFSMGMFESKVLKYPGPSILLLRGTTEDESAEKDGKEVLFGAYISTPWKSSTKENFGDRSSILFQLVPTHSVYPSAPYHTQFAYFHPRIGLGFGSPPPQLLRRQSLTSRTLIQHTSDPQVSLSLDPSLEHAKFTHIPPGATFQSSLTAGEYSLKIEIGEVEVWGCGVDDARDEQKRAWEYERKEAERRQNVRVREDLAGDRALLEMAGIIGGSNRSGGSV